MRSGVVGAEEEGAEILRSVRTRRGGPGECCTGGGEDCKREGDEAEVSHGKSLFGTVGAAGVPRSGDASRGGSGWAC